MLERGAVEALVASYVEALDARDADRVTALFTEDAVHDHPMSHGLDVGPDQIRAFHEQTFTVPLTARLDGPVTIHRQRAAFRVLIEVPAGRTPFRLLITELLDVSPDGRISHLVAVPDSTVLNG